MLPDNDLDLWKWVTGGFCAIVVWIGKNTWKASSTITEMKADIAQLQAIAASHEAKCKVMQSELAASLTASLKSAFDSMQSETVLDHTKELAEINKNLALLAQRNESLGEQVSKLADKVDKIYVGGVDSGLRRRSTDCVKGGN